LQKAIYEGELSKKFWSRKIMQGSNTYRDSDPKNFDQFLNELIELMESERNQLPESEIETFVDELQKMIGQNKSNLVRMIQKYNHLPESLIAKLIQRIWADLKDDTKTMIHEELTHKLPHNTNIQAHKLRVKLAMALRNGDAIESLKLITFSCRKSLTGHENAPSRPFCSLLLNELVVPDDFPLSKIPFPIPSDDRQLLVTCALRSCIRFKKSGFSADPKILSRVVEWISEKKFKFELPAYLRYEISQSIAKWPSELSDKAEWIYGQLGHQQQLVLSEQQDTIQTSDVSATKQELESSSETTQNLVETQSDEISADDINSRGLREAVSRVLHYSAALETELGERIANNERQLADNKAALGALRSELAINKASLEAISKSLEEKQLYAIGLKKQIEKHKIEKAAFETKIEHFEARIGQIEQQLAISTEHNKKLEQDKDELAKRVDIEAAYQVNVLKNKIKKALTIDLREIETLESVEMTVNLGMNLRSQIKTIFAKLNHLGIGLGDTENG
jgi:hypothetical protein